MTYLFVITFFVAIFTLDEKRIEQRRNAFIPCIIHSEERSKICLQKNLMHTFLKYIYSNFILTKVGKVSVVQKQGVSILFSLMSIIHCSFR